MVDDEQRHAADFRRRGEPDDGLALSVRSEPLERPALLGGLAARRRTTAAALRIAGTSTSVALLRLVDDLSRVVAATAGSGHAARPGARARRDVTSWPTNRRQRADGDCGYSYSSASTSDPRTADSAGQSAATNAAPSMIGNEREHRRRRETGSRAACRRHRAARYRGGSTD